MKSESLKKIKQTSGIPQAAVVVGNKVCMLKRLDRKVGSSLFLSWSSNGIDFEDDDKKVSIELSGTKKEKISNCKNFSISATPSAFVMTYVRKGTVKDKNMFVVARSRDLYEWKVKSEISALGSNRATVIYDKKIDSFEMYKDGLFVKNQSTKTLSVWKNESLLLFTSRFGMFDSDNLSIIGGVETSRGIFLAYSSTVKKDSHILLQAGAVIFDMDNPKHILWRSDAPIWQGVVETKKTRSNICPVASIYLKDQFILYWVSESGDLLIAVIPSLLKNFEIAQYKILKKSEKNPVIEPRPELAWEAVGTFNPGVFQDENDVLHLFYRAVGSDGISRIGYASSKDGIHFDKRLPYPVFEPHKGFGMPDKKTFRGPIGYNPSYYTSGGGWGGSEDPRVVRFGDRIYMTYVAFEGWWSIRIALTSISIEDFKKGRWNWSQPILLSPPNAISKNWLIFPEKINGKYAVLHSIAPNISIDYLSTLDKFERHIKSPRLEGPQPGREGKWDGRIRGAGPPPVKTELGWLLLYHAIDDREPGKYKLGAMILDSQDPTKILYRSEHPILYPDMWYENKGKPGIVYASGAVIRDKDLYIYYGGADRVVCVAHTPLKDFLDYLVKGKSENYKLEKVSIF